MYKRQLVLSEYIKKYELTADAQMVRKTIEELASTYEQPQEVVEWYYSNQEQLASIESQVVEDKLVEKFLESATVTELSCSYKEAVSMVQQNG